MKAILYVFCFFLSIVSCHQSGQKEQVVALLQEWQGKRIVIPDSMYTIQGNKCFFDTTIHRYRILNYVDSVGCLSCNLKLQEWNMLSKEFQDKKCQVIPLFVFYPGNIAKIKEIRTLVKSNQTDFPIIIDTLNVINSLNKFPKDTRFHIYLLDKHNDVLAIGNPVLNPKVKELYLKIIQGKPLQDEGEKKQVQTTVSLDTTTLSLGKFPWQEEQQATFTLKNTGDEFLVIHDVVTSCGCLQVDYSQEPVRPGKEAVLHLTYKADYAGYVSKTVQVYCNAKGSPVKFWVKGEAE